jgi:hypothetical protein
MILLIRLHLLQLALLARILFVRADRLLPKDHFGENSLKLGKSLFSFQNDLGRPLGSQ